MMRISAVALALACALCGAARAASWPAYRGGAGRAGYTAEQPPARLSLRWTYKPAHPPAPAWPSEPRMAFDRAYHVVADGERVYFGSSADCKVYALDAATGRERWTFFTGGPVRFAPALWKDRVFAASDDGWLYCLSARDGKLLWKKRPAPSGRMVLGNGRMVSKWLARGGPAVVGDVVYVGAGIWPTEGIYIAALNAGTGKTVWVNGESGSIGMAQPHSGAWAKSGISCQGYLAAAGDRVFVPTGRAGPAAFNRADGKFQYFSWRYGGSGLAAVDSMVFSGSKAFDAAKGKYLGVGGSASQPAASPEIIYVLGYNTLYAVDRRKPLIEKTVKKRITRKWNAKWSARVNHRGVTSLIAAGKTVFIARGKEVAAFDTEQKKVTWSAEVKGAPRGLAFAAGRLYVSTEEGPIHCFAAGAAGAKTVGRKPEANPYPDNRVYAAAAEEIVRKTGAGEGYCLDLGCGEGQLAFELAKRTKLHIYAVEKDPAKVALARKRLDAAGLYGVRVTVFEADPAKTGLPNHFADLVVSGNSVAGGSVPQKEALRCRRPYGGVLCVGKPGAMKKTVRGPLPGAGSWTHQYADAANTACSDDALVKGALTVLWYGDPGQQVANRHGRPPAPLVADGRLYVQGLDEVCAYNAYNGRMLWKLPLKGVTKPNHQEHLVGVAVTGSNMCLWKGTLFLHTGGECLRIEGATGKKLGEFKTPPGADGKPGTWGYLACADGVLFGSLADTEHVVNYAYGRSDMKRIFSESKELFALDAATGKLKWRYQAEKSIRHNAIAAGGGTVYLIDRAAAAMDRFGYKPKKGEKLPEHPTGALVALDAASGRRKWKRTEKIYGTALILGLKHDTLLMSYQPTRFRQRSEVGGRLAAFRASTGKPLYDEKASYRTRPVLNGRTLYGEPYAHDLLTGKRKANWRFKRSYGCGILAGGKHVLTFRSATLGYVDVTDKEGTRNFGGMRPGCWINAVPAGGLVLVPDYTYRCSCNYQIKVTLALEPRE